MNFDLQSILRALAMASGLQRGVMDPALFNIGRNRDKSLDDLDSSIPPFFDRVNDADSELEAAIATSTDPLKSTRATTAESFLDRIMRESKDENARRDAEADAKLQAEVQATRATPKPMQSPTVARWREATANQAQASTVASTLLPTMATGAPVVSPSVPSQQSQVQSPALTQVTSQAMQPHHGRSNSDWPATTPPQQSQLPPSLQEHLSTIVSAQLNSPTGERWQANNATSAPSEPEVVGWKDFRSRFTDKTDTFDSDAANAWAVAEAKKAIEEKRKFALRIEGKERQIVRTDDKSMYDAKGRAWGSMTMALGTGDDAFVIERPQTRSGATTSTADTSRSPLPPTPQTEPPTPTLEQDLASVVEAQGRVNTDDTRDAASDAKSPSALSTATDVLQMGLDAVGVVDPTPISDGINAVWSLGRAFTDPERRSEHLTNAGISAVSMIPYIGDSAKLLKTGRYAKTASRVANFNSGASAATKASQRGEIRDAAGAVLGAGSSGNDTDVQVNAGGSGGGYFPPRSPGLSPGGDDEERESEAAARGFFDKLEGAGEALLAFAGPLGKAVVATVGFVKGLELMNSGVLALNKELAPYNAQLSAAYARYEVDELNRNIDKGNVMQGPMSKLIEEQSELKTSLDRLTNPLQAMSVGVQAKLTEVVNIMLTATQAIEVSSGFLEGIKAVVFELFGIIEPEIKAGAGQAFFRDVSDGRFDGREPVFGGRGSVRMPEFKTEQERRDLFGP